MAEALQARDIAAQTSGEAMLQRALILDLEVSLSGRIHEVGAVLGEDTYWWRSKGGERECYEHLAAMADKADLVLGHNLRRHDLARLRESLPGHPILSLPAVDTLELSPLAFPANPYHRLVKDYKLVSQSVNDPVADARLAGQVCLDELHAFEALRRRDPGLFRLIRALLTMTEPQEAEGLGPHGYDAFFAPFPTSMEEGAAVMPIAAVTEGVRVWVGDRGCRGVTLDRGALQTEAQRFSLAYALAWLSVAGTDSVLPSWVRRTFPESGDWIRRWREVPCGRTECGYCRVTHDPLEPLKRYFRFDDFRARPATPSGGSQQREIVAAGMRDESLLAVLPTGGGKSICFQLPAIVRHFRRGALTVVLSPLQALMKDQVDGLVRRTGMPFAAALYGMQTGPERGAVLRDVASGKTAILYVAPEQLRNRSFEKALSQREVGCWVFDEAHCLSKWGHDFRPDYLYAGRFIREFAKRHGTVVPSIACFTATAKREVREEILSHFRSETGRELSFFEGGVERDNLDFEVQAIQPYGKLERLTELLEEMLPPGRPGAVVVFRSRRDATQETAEYLLARGWKAAFFHAGLTPPEKKRIQEEFLAGDTQVICATNAFGMGIDKEDVRLVIHLDTPGSLENYLQEAGRAGRDGQRAACVLLYNEADCEEQFRLGARSELTLRDLTSILQTVRRADRDDTGEVVLTSGEILRDEETESTLSMHDRMGDTKVRTGIAWLERAGYLQRDSNVTTVFQAAVLVPSMAEAETRVAGLQLPVFEQTLWLAILHELIGLEVGESLTVDRLALLPEFERLARGTGKERPTPGWVSSRIFKILKSMDQAGLVRRDIRLSAFVRHKVVDHSRLRLKRLVTTERCLIGLLAEAEPEPEGWLPLALRPLNQRLLDESCETSLDLVRSILVSLSEDGRGFAGSHGSLELRYLSQDSYRVRVVRNWRTIEELADRRRRVAAVVLEELLARIPESQPARADVLVEFGFNDLQAALERDALLHGEVRDVDAALERALMYLHEQKVIVLQHGLAIFRSAMTLRLTPERRRERYRKSDFEPLKHHYWERMLQVHVMAEYARCGLQRIQDAQALVAAYFTQKRQEFLHRFFRGRLELLQHATTEASFRRIVTDLGNVAQERIVTAPVAGNHLVLAGPGSGKTRVVVHRCAYLLRVERVPPRSILVCCFNRSAALEVRRRLADLVGDDARGVLVQTYHGLALRLLGRSLQTQHRQGKGPVGQGELDGLIEEAVALLEGKCPHPGLEADEVRDRLLAGFQHILVDEYQDIDEPQYAMISAIAGRTLSDADQRLSILAVGDDDQNIYAFRGANVRFIGQFQEDYDARVHYLVENHRATRYLIEAANQCIALNRDRMKREQPIRIDHHRELLPPGGDFGRTDREGQGRVRIRTVQGIGEQAWWVLQELRRLQDLGVADTSRMAVLGETHRDLAGVRRVLEQESIPLRWMAARSSYPVSLVREVRQVLGALWEHRRETLTASRLLVIARERLLGTGMQENPWGRFLQRQMEAWRTETGDAEVATGLAHEYLLEACAEARRGEGCEPGVALGTVHSAKGLEFDHVLLIGGWCLPAKEDEQEEMRRAFYVGMTRARQTLTVIQRAKGRPGCADGLEGPWVQRVPSAVKEGVETLPGVSYEEVGLDELDLGYAGRRPAHHPVHAALLRLEPGSRLRWGQGNAKPDELTDSQGVPVVRFSSRGWDLWGPRMGRWREIRVVALLARTADMDTDAERREAYRVTDWEVPVLEMVVDDSR
jgi:ATP-dependent DNA helicase RecQ